MTAIVTDVEKVVNAVNPFHYKPAVGRIVQFFKQGNPQGEAAMITRVWSDTTVNLSVFVDSSPAIMCYSSVTNDPLQATYWVPPAIL